MLGIVSEKLNNLALAQKLTLILLLIFVLGITFSGFALANTLNYKARSEITSNTLLLLQTLNSVRYYTNSEVSSQLEARTSSEAFLPQIVPAYSSRRVFEILRKNNKSYEEFLYKEAMLNPTNIKDRADSFEEKIIQNFIQDKNLKETSGFRSFAGEKYFYVARPSIITDATCLRCHSTPEVAPKEMIKIYGDKNGMGWNLNEVLGAQIVSVPTSEVLQKANQSLNMVMSIVTIIFGLAIFVSNFWVRRYVVRPIKRVVHVAEAVSTGDMTADFEKASNDEVGSLVEAFTRMKLSLLMAIRKLEKYRTENRESNDRY
ncbi:c-type heme family protein [Iningainema tapete]|uniref:histidine kinase n=1 Tax=Iningainema tapete BLCC-T55 TaxID=2748662 RepID=A0A8J6XM94_9CYAN|nr:DUF3365 domain-containing protein [Iningainema tapete]MBD2775481.1 DUF3365 domain-containing protein [Iningainema tapete BLCC-T55]